MEELENMKVPDPEMQPDSTLKKTILNTQASTRLGIALIILPGILLFTMILKEELGVNLGITNAIADLITSLDKSPYTHWMSPVLFGIFPLIAVVILALSMVHVAYYSSKKQLHIVVKFNLRNVILLVISFGILASITLYIVLENLGHLLNQG